MLSKFIFLFIKRRVIIFGALLFDTGSVYSLGTSNNIKKE